MDNALNPWFILVAAMAVSTTLIPVALRLAPRLGLMDRPDLRKVHDVPMARVGGWGIVLGSLLPLLVALPMDPLLASYLWGAGVLLVFGAVDDHHDIGHWGKFAGQFLAVAPVVVYGGLVVDRLPLMGLEHLSPIIGVPFTVFAMVGVINALNHSDGLDGLAAGEALLSLMVIAFLAYLQEGMTTLALALAVIGGILGFLRYNTYPARLFMGDAGSQFLGFSLAFLTVHLFQRVNPALSPALPALILGLPVIDILVVLFLRIRHGMHWFRASRNHLHHRLLDLGFSHHRTVVIIYSLQALLVTSAVFLRYSWDPQILAWYALVCSGVFGLVFWAERLQWRVPEPYTPSVNNESPARAGHLQLSSAWLGLAVPVYLVVAATLVGPVPRDFGLVSAVLCVVLVLDLVFGRGGGSVMVRGVAYATATFVVYLSEHALDLSLSPPRVVDGILFLSMGIAIWRLVRHPARDRFNVTPLDYLMLFVVIALGVFYARDLSDPRLAILAFKILVILYGCEVLIGRVTGRWSPLALACLGVLCLLGVRGLIY